MRKQARCRTRPTPDDAVFSVAVPTPPFRDYRVTDAAEAAICRRVVTRSAIAIFAPYHFTDAVFRTAKPATRYSRITEMIRSCSLILHRGVDFHLRRVFRRPIIFFAGEHRFFCEKRYYASLARCPFERRAARFCSSGVPLFRAIKISSACPPVIAAAPPPPPHQPAFLSFFRFSTLNIISAAHAV